MAPVAAPFYLQRPPLVGCPRLLLPRSRSPPCSVALSTRFIPTCPQDLSSLVHKWKSAQYSLLVVYLPVSVGLLFNQDYFLFSLCCPLVCRFELFYKSSLFFCSFRRVFYLLSRSLNFFLNNSHFLYKFFQFYFRLEFVNLVATMHVCASNLLFNLLAYPLMILILNYCWFSFFFFFQFPTLKLILASNILDILNKPT